MKKIFYCAFLTLVALSALFFFTSCDPEVEYFIQVNNQSSRDIEVTYNSWATLEEQPQVETLAPNEIKLLVMVSDLGSEEFEEPVSNFIDTISISSSPDSILSKRDFLSNDSWTYELGLYEAIITDADFD